MRHFTSFLVGCAVLLFGVASISASIGPIGPNVARLCAHADLVVVGRAAAVHQDGPTTLLENGTTYPGRLMVVDLQVEWVLKGAAGRTVTFTFKAPSVPVVSVGGAGVAVGEFGVFFLRNAPQEYEVLDPDFPSIVAWPGSRRTSGSVVDQVTAEVAHALDSDGAPSSLKQQAVSVLASLRSPAATAALKAATTATHQPINIRLAAAGVLLARNDISVLGEVQQWLLSNNQSIGQNVKDSVAGAIGFGVKNPHAIPLLEPLTHSNDVYVRRGAAAALRNTHDPAAIQPLSKALYDPDREVRYYAVVGLGEITGQNEWTPAIANFNQNEKRFLDHWRAWAKRHQPARAPKAAEPSH